MSIADAGPTVPGPSLVPLHCLAFAEPQPPRPSTLPNGTPVWLVSRHHDVRQVLTDPRFTRALLYAPDAPPLTDTPNLVTDPNVLFNQDGDDHRRLRRTVQRAFTPRVVECWRPWVASVVDQLLEDLAKTEQPADAVELFALPLPVAVISRLMGLDGLDLNRLRYWTDHAFADGGQSPDEVTSALREFTAFSAELLAQRRREPGTDLVSRLVEAAAQEASIPEEQLVYLLCGLVVGGHDTTMTALSNALVFLLSERPQAWARIGADEEAAGLAADRVLHSIPLGEGRGSERRAATEVEVGGVVIPAGAVVLTDVGVANRDPEVFSRWPLDSLFTPLEAPSLAFGAGPHHCLGSWLARMEMQLALHRLARRFPSLRLSEPVESIVWRQGNTTRSPLHLPVTW